MESGEIVVSITVLKEALDRIFVLLLYLPTCVFCYWKLGTRLSPMSSRLAVGMLAAQMLLIVMSVEIGRSSGFWAYAFDIDKEHNILSTLSSTLLATVGSVSLVTAYVARTRTAWQRLYLVGMSLVFLFLALDEYFEVGRSSFHANWERNYAVVGAITVLATIAMAMRSPRRARKWQLCLIAGLATIAVGGLVIDTQVNYCGRIGFIQLHGCLRLIVLEEILELLGGWLVLAAMLGHFSDALPAPTRLVRRTLYAFPALWILMLFLNSFTARLEFSLLAQSASVRFESGAQLQGYHIDIGDGAARIRLYVSARQEDYLDVVGYSIFLMDQSTGDIVLSQYAKSDRQHGVVLFGPDYVPVYRQSIDVSFGQEIPVHRAIWVALALRHYVNGENETQTIVDSDHQQLGDRLVVLGEFVLPTVSAASPTIPVAVFDNGFTLDAFDMPERARPGETVSAKFTWRADQAGREDHVQFLHLGHEKRGEWWVHDQQPLGARLPTRLWYSGLHDSETWQVPLPADMVPGRYDIFTGLYRVRDQQRVPASDAAGNPYLDARVPLGNLMIGSGDGS